MDPAQWKMERKPRGSRGKGRPKRPPSFLHMDADTKAVQSWRRLDEPSERIRIPEALAMNEERFHNQLAREYGTFIFSVQKRAAAGSIEFGIWGENDAAAATKKAILEVLSEFEAPKAKKSTRASRFPTLHSMTAATLKRVEKAWKREVARNKYRQYPHPSQSFGAIGTFHWPANEWRPDKILGPNFEALDPIRMDCSCYVVFVSEKAAFHVMGKADDVKTALARLRKTCFQIAARQIAPVRMYLLHWATADELPSHIVLKQYTRPIIMSGQQPTDQVVQSIPRGLGVGDDGSRLVDQTSDNEQRVRDLVLCTLQKLHYYRSSLQMRITFGNFLAISFKKSRENKYTLNEYEDMIAESQFAGEVTQELGDAEIERNALSALQQATTLLVPKDALTHDLAAVRPVYSVVIVFPDEGGELQLAMTWAESQDDGSSRTELELSSKKWTRLERQGPTTVPILDLFLQNLDTGSAWHFNVESVQPVEDSRLPENLRGIGNSIRLDLDTIRQERTDKPFVNHRAFTRNVKSIHQCVSYRFGVKASDYTVELSRFQVFAFPQHRSPTLQAATKPTVYEPRWSLEVYRTEWDQMFTVNERLAVGERADWDASADVWFPEDMTEDSSMGNDGRGISQLMEKLNVLSRLMKQAKDEDLIGGMVGMAVE